MTFITVKANGWTARKERSGRVLSTFLLQTTLVVPGKAIGRVCVCVRDIALEILGMYKKKVDTSNFVYEFTM